MTPLQQVPTSSRQSAASEHGKGAYFEELMHSHLPCEAAYTD